MRPRAQSYFSAGSVSQGSILGWDLLLRTEGGATLLSSPKRNEASFRGGRLTLYVEKSSGEPEQMPVLIKTFKHTTTQRNTACCH